MIPGSFGKKAGKINRWYIALHVRIYRDFNYIFISNSVEKYTFWGTNTDTSVYVKNNEHTILLLPTCATRVSGKRKRREEWQHVSACSLGLFRLIPAQLGSTLAEPLWLSTESYWFSSDPLLYCWCFWFSDPRVNGSSAKYH